MWVMSNWVKKNFPQLRGFVLAPEEGVAAFVKLFLDMRLDSNFRASGCGLPQDLLDALHVQPGNCWQMSVGDS